MNHPEIAILVETSTSWGEGIVRGIMQYARENNPWYIHHEPHGRYENIHLPRGWRGDGIIARVISPELAREIRRSKIPAVNVSSIDIGKNKFPSVTSDDFAIGRVAAGHLLERGLKRFSYCPPLHRDNYTDRMQQGFIETLQASGYMCDVYQPKGNSQRFGWAAQRSNLENWLQKLPKPSGMLAWNATRGRQVTEAARYAGIAVPEEVSVVAGEYDALACSISTPPLSYVSFSTSQIGYQAAALLSRLMQGEAPPETAVLVQPGGVAPSVSTDVTAAADPLMVKALRFIRENALEGITVGDVVEQVPMNRRMFERRFRDLLGRGPASEIRTLRITHARLLLADTALPIFQVALACGFSNPEAFTRSFRSSVGESPLSYRRRVAQS